jgi:hypothetical protein
MNRKRTMRRILSRWAVPLVLALVCGLSPAAAQNSDFQDLHPNAKTGIIPSAAPTAAPDAGDKTEKPAPTLSYFAAVLSAVVVLCIICVPSRKSESMTSR